MALTAALHSLPGRDGLPGVWLSASPRGKQAHSLGEGDGLWVLGEDSEEGVSGHFP